MNYNTVPYRNTRMRARSKGSLLPVCVGKLLTDVQELKRVTELALYQALVDRCDWWILCKTNDFHDTIGCAAFKGIILRSPLSNLLSPNIQNLPRCDLDSKFMHP